MYRLGAGFHPSFLSPNPGARVPAPTDCQLVELGVWEWERWRQISPIPYPLSLHLARTPIVEAADAQARFVADLPNLESHFVSIGLHLTGPRTEGLGRYGFSSHYTPGGQAQARAIDFVKRIQDRFGLPVWIENANFYSRTSLEILQSWEGLVEVVSATQSRTILDLSHLLIDAHNVGLSPKTALGAVPWNTVAEVHLSGVVKGSDGKLHDGHSLPVEARVWELLAGALQENLLPRTVPVYFTLEHTGIEWSDHHDRYREDFETLREMLEKSPQPALLSPDNSSKYALSFLEKLFRQRFASLGARLDDQGPGLRNTLADWTQEILQRKKRLVLTPQEAKEADTVHFFTGFSSHCTEVLKNAARN